MRVGIFLLFFALWRRCFGGGSLGASLLGNPFYRLRILQIYGESFLSRGGVSGWGLWGGLGFGFSRLCFGRALGAFRTRFAISRGGRVF